MLKAAFAWVSARVALLIAVAVPPNAPAASVKSATPKLSNELFALASML